MSDKERREVLNYRKQSHLSWHYPPHHKNCCGDYHITAACYEHSCFIGHSLKRLSEFEESIIDLFSKNNSIVFAYCILPNHYHFLIKSENIETIVKLLGKFHGAISYKWNGEENTRGRHVWHGCVERAMKTERHFYTTLNYIHNNPVHHGYVKKWQEWNFSSANQYIEKYGIDEVKKIWLEFPVLDYGKGWDERCM